MTKTSEELWELVDLIDTETLNMRKAGWENWARIGWDAKRAILQLAAQVPCGDCKDGKIQRPDLPAANGWLDCPTCNGTGSAHPWAKEVKGDT